jgi:hypothetical protein
LATLFEPDPLEKLLKTGIGTDRIEEGMDFQELQNA